MGAHDIGDLRFSSERDRGEFDEPSREIDMLRVGELMAPRGWLPGLVREPHAMHLMLSMLHAPAKDDYLRDLAAAVAQVREERGTTAKLDVTY